MINWENLRFFLAVAKEGNMSAAARRLGVDHATVGRRITSMEEELAQRLFDRQKKECVLTDFGQQLLPAAQKMELEVFSIERMAQAWQGHANSLVSISTLPVVADNFLIPLVPLFKRLHGGIGLSISSAENPVSLTRRDADIALWHFRPNIPDYIATKVGVIQFGLYAAHTYAHRRSPKQWEFVGYDINEGDFEHRRQLEKLAGNRSISFRVSDVSGQVALVRAGVGVGLLPRFIAANHTELNELDDSDAPFKLDLWMVIHRDLRNSMAVKLVRDFIKDQARSLLR